MTALASEPIRYGYSLNDLDRIAHAAVAMAYSQSGDYWDRHAAARYAIVDRLYANPTPPRRGELRRLAIRAVNDHAIDEGHHHGVDRNTPCSGRGSMRAFGRYWSARRTPSHEDRIVEAVALPQILGALPPRQREAIDALAAHDDYAQAAEALGVSYDTLVGLVRRARATMLLLWHEDETPPKLPRDQRAGPPLTTHCSAGHEWTPENTRIRYRVSGGRARPDRVCRACEHERSLARTRAARQERAA